MMKWIRLILIIAFLGVFGCASIHTPAEITDEDLSTAGIDVDSDDNNAIDVAYGGTNLVSVSANVLAIWAAADYDAINTLLGTAFLAEAKEITANWINTNYPWADNEVSDTLTSSIFKDANSTTDAVDLATTEVAGTLPAVRISTDIARAAEANTITGDTHADNSVPTYNGADAKTLQASPLIVSDSGAMTGGTSLDLGESATPIITQRDTGGSDGYWEVNAFDGTDSESAFSVDDSTGRKTRYLVLHGQDENINLKYAIVLDGEYYAATPQALSVTADIDSMTIGTEITKAVIFITGDDDSDNDELDLQDGTVSGQLVTFVGGADIDADDTITIDVREDSTCTGCPDSGTFVMDDPGDKVSYYWNGTLSAWFYMGSYEVD